MCVFLNVNSSCKDRFNVIQYIQKQPNFDYTADQRYTLEI